MVALPLIDNFYWMSVRSTASALESDGCSRVPDFYLDACLEHDIHYKTGKDIFLQPISRKQADARFKAVIQSLSKFGKWSPLSYWRWAAVRLFAGKYWQGE